MIVVDASVAVKWFLNEAYSKDALALLSADEKLIAPQLVAYEVAGAFVRARRRGDIDDVELEEIIQSWTAAIDASILYVQYEAKDVHRASTLASEIGHTIADCVYLAMAERFNAPLITADKVFYEKVASDFRYVNFIADVAPNACLSGSER